jgi:AP-4 complex subunit sigma-1
MFNLERAHFLLDEMVVNGEIIDTNKPSILKPITMMEKESHDSVITNKSKS